MTGIVGNKWSFDEFAPMDVIPYCRLPDHLCRRIRRLHADAFSAAR